MMYKNQFENKLLESLNKSSVRIETHIYEKLIDFGTGFFITPNIVCTAKHVIRDAKCKEQISVYWNESKLEIKNYKISDKYDIAFLEVDKTSSSSWLLFDCFDTKTVNDKYAVYGFTNDYFEYGEPIILEYSGQHNDDSNNPLLAFKGDKTPKGLSGSAILNLNSGFVVGVMRLSRDTESPLGGRGTPTNIVLSEFFKCWEEKFFDQFRITNVYLQNIEKNQIEKLCLSYCNKNLLSYTIDYTHRAVKAQKSWEIISKVSSYLQFIYNKRNAFLNNEYLLLASFIGEQMPELIPDFEKVIKYEYDANTNNEFIKTAIDYLQTRIYPFNERITVNIQEYKRKNNSSLIAGSSCLRQDKLFSGEKNLLVPFEWKSRDRKAEHSSLLTTIFDGIINCLNFTIIANPGAGKSTFAKALFYNLLSLRQKKEINVLPLYADLHDDIHNTLTFGDEVWIKTKLEDIYGTEIFEYINIDFSDVVFILDGLDEYLSGCAKEDIDSFFDTPVVKNMKHVIITCRTQFFDRYIKFNNVAIQHYTIEILPWKSKNKNDYICDYLDGLKEQRGLLLDNEVKSQIIAQINSSLFLSDISNIPLYLNMTLEVLCDAFVGEGSLPEITSLVDLYRIYTELWIEYERSKTPSSYYGVLANLNTTQVIALLSLVSWQFYDEAINTGCKISRFSQEALHRYIEALSITKTWESVLKKVDISLLTNYIISRTLIVGEKNLKFIHKSFQEYLISHYMFELLIDPSANIRKIADFHEKIITPEVSEFLKGQLKSVNESIIYKRLILKNCIKALKAITLDAEDDAIHSRIGREQITYNIGLLAIPESIQFLKDYLKEEKDLWIRRGVIIGLSFSGDESELHKYVERMYTERRNGGDCPENNVNLGFSLSFFGDQQFDDQYPDVDLHCSGCKNTVTRLVYQLSTVIDRPSWRTNLYTLLDLAHNRSVSKKEYWETITLLHDEIATMLDKVESFSDDVAKWPEISEMRKLINSLNKGENNHE